MDTRTGAFLTIRTLCCIAIVTTASFGQANSYSKEKEVALGQGVAQELRSHTTAAGNTDADTYVKRVGSSIAAQMSSRWTWQFEVVLDDLGEPMHEPVALPGGFIFVPQALFPASRSEAEFAGMLAHAMAQVDARHRMPSAAKNSLGWVATGQPAPVGYLSFGRQLERDADLIAVQAMAAAGYNPAGLVSYIGRMQPPPPSNPALDPLPGRDQRLTDIGDAIATLPARTYHTSDEFARVQASLRQ